MTNERQLCLAYNGNPDSLPIADHPGDIVYREDTEDTARAADSVRGTDGLWYSDQEAADEHDEERWEALWEAFEIESEKWNDEYVESDDYGAEYAYLMSENPIYVSKRIVEWIREMWPVSKTTAERIVDEVFDDIVDSADATTANEYSSTPSGLYLDSFAVGETEDQVEWSRFVEWCEEHAPEDIRGDAPPMSFVNSQCYHANMKSDDRYPCFYLYHNTGIRWDYVCPDEVAAELILNASQGMRIPSADIPGVIRLQSELRRRLGEA